MEISMKKYTICITDYLRRDIHFDKELLGNDIEVKLLQTLNEKELFPAIAEADAIFVDKTPITEYTLSRIPKCKIIARYGIGYDNVDIQAAGKHGIYVVNCPDFCHEEVADHAMGFLLDLTRNIVDYNNGLLEGNVKNWGPFGRSSTLRLRNKTVGIVGLGRIGKEVAKRLRGFNLNVIFYDPFVDANAGNIVGAEKVDSLEKLLGVSDIVTLHTPLNAETKGMANESFFKKMKKGAYIINTSRGGVLNMLDLLHAMESGQVEKAALDVLEEEPFNMKHPLIQRWMSDKAFQSRLILTPHAAFFSPESTKDIEGKMLANVKAVLQGKKPINCVNTSFLPERLR